MKLPDVRKEKLLAEVQVSASRSGGPGGQNVNKVNTKIDIRFNIDASAELSDDEKKLIRLKLKNKINAEGDLIVTASSERSQWRNRDKAENKFIEWIEKSLTINKRRKKTQPTASSRLKRIENKKKQAQKKELRKPPGT